MQFSKQLSNRYSVFDRVSSHGAGSDKLQLRENIIRDLEALLNCATRSAHKNYDKHDYIKFSVLNYGLPTISHVNDSPKEILNNARHIKRIIEIYEPRIMASHLKVTPILNRDYNHVLCVFFNVEGVVCIGEYKESFGFRVALDYSSGAFKVLEHA